MLAIDQSLSGTFNLTGTPMPFREFLQSCKAVTRSAAEFTWVPQDFLHQHGLDNDLVLGTYAGYFPLWRPPGTNPGLFRVSSAKAYRAGWRTRPFEETALDCMEFFRSLGDRLDWTDRLSAEKEREVLAAWDGQGAG